MRSLTAHAQYLRGELAGIGIEMEDMDTVVEDAIEKEPVKAEPCNSVQSYDRSQLPNLLRIYYSWLFPYDKYFEWLQYGEFWQR